MSTHNNRSAAGDFDFRVQTNLYLITDNLPTTKLISTESLRRSHFDHISTRAMAPIDTDRNQTIYYSLAFFH